MRGQPKSFDWRVILKRKEKLNRKKIKRMRINLKMHTINFDWMMKLKTNETLTKKPKKKNMNQKNKGWIGKNNIW